MFSFYFNDYYTISLIWIREFLLQTQPCAPILYSFIKTSIVRTRVHHSGIFSHSTIKRTMLEDVWFANKKHKFWGNPHTISINPTSPMNRQMISYLKLVLINLVPPPAWSNIQFIKQIFDSLMNSSYINAWQCLTIILAFFETIANLSNSFPIKNCKICQFNSFGIDIPLAVDTKILSEIHCNSSSPGLISSTLKNRFLDKKLENDEDNGPK